MSEEVRSVKMARKLTFVRLLPWLCSPPPRDAQSASPLDSVHADR